MKTLLLVACLAFLQATQAQTKQQKDSLRAARVADMVNSQDFDFKAQTAIPMGGQTRHLSLDYYDLAVSKDTIVAYLPYYGRAYSAPPPGQSGIQFTSTNFVYVPSPDKKGGWNISIKPKDVSDVSQMNLYISANGYATLQVVSISRQSISFNGVAGKRKKGK